MSTSLLLGDYHVHSTFSDDASSTLEENVAAALAAGLTTLRLVDHVRRDTTWVPEFLSAIANLETPNRLTVLSGVEAKILNTSGDLDIPKLPTGIDRILIADHQFPGSDGPLTPATVKERLVAGWSADDALDDLVEGYVRVMNRYPGNQLAHSFSILEKIGLSETQLGAERLNVWAAAAARTDTQVEVSEKWGCPSPESIAVLKRAGATLVASTDSHEAATVGRYRRVRALLKEAEQAE